MAKLKIPIFENILEFDHYEINFNADLKLCHCTASRSIQTRCCGNRSGKCPRQVVVSFTRYQHTASLSLVWRSPSSSSLNHDKSNPRHNIISPINISIHIFKSWGVFPLKTRPWYHYKNHFKQNCNYWIYACVHAQSLSHVWLSVTTWTVAHQALLSVGFSRQAYWSRYPFPSPGDLPDPGIEPASPALAGRYFTTEPSGKPIEFIAYVNHHPTFTIVHEIWMHVKVEFKTAPHLRTKEICLFPRCCACQRGQGSHRLTCRTDTLSIPLLWASLNRSAKSRWGFPLHVVLRTLSSPCFMLSIWQRDCF